MNKQELVNKIKELDGLDLSKNYTGGAFMVNRYTIISLVNQLDEPQKVVIPRFVDSFIRYAKDEGMSLFTAMDNAQSSDWFAKNEEIFARAWLDGYEVEQEKLYTVEIPNPNRKGRGHARFRLEKSGNKVYLVKRKSSECYQNKDNQKLTEAEIKKDFEWAWKWAEEVKE